LVDLVAISRATWNGLLAITTFGLRLEWRLGPVRGSLYTILPSVVNYTIRVANYRLQRSWFLIGWRVKHNVAVLERDGEFSARSEWRDWLLVMPCSVHTLSADSHYRKCACVRTYVRTYIFC
jgi:hypothetical protein